MHRVTPAFVVPLYCDNDANSTCQLRAVLFQSRGENPSDQGASSEPLLGSQGAEPPPQCYCWRYTKPVSLYLKKAQKDHPPSNRDRQALAGLHWAMAQLWPVALCCCSLTPSVPRFGLIIVQLFLTIRIRWTWLVHKEDDFGTCPWKGNHALMTKTRAVVGILSCTWVLHAWAHTLAT